MMNRFEGRGGSREAKIRYLDGDFQILMPGSHVICAMTGETIPVDELRYWSVARQEAYVSCAASLDAPARCRRRSGNPARFLFVTAPHPTLRATFSPRGEG